MVLLAAHSRMRLGELLGFELTAEVRGIDDKSVRSEFVGNLARSIEFLTNALR
jgi:hypothetical protein